MLPTSLRLIVLVAAVALAVPDAVVLEARPPTTRAEVEGNDTAATATPLNLVGAYGIATGAIGVPGDVDYWSFPATSFNFISILCDTGGAQGAGATSRRVTLDFIGPNGQTLESDSGDGTGNGGDGSIETLDAAVIANAIIPTGGTFYIRVSGAAAGDIVEPYRLVVAITPLGNSREAEPNDGSTAANPIAIAGSFGFHFGAIGSAGDQDYFSIRASAGEVVFFALDTRLTGGSSDLAVDLLAPDGITSLLSVDAAPAGSASDPAGESANFTIPSSGVYFLRVREVTGTRTGGYKLMAIARPFSDAPGDLDGDFLTDWGVYSSTGLWTVFRTTTFLTTATTWGDPSRGDVPVPADYDGDGAANLAVYRESTGEWTLREANGNGTVIQWGAPGQGDVPVPGDYDGDRRYDLAVYRRTTGDWFVRFSRGGASVVRWGAPWLDDIPVPADYDGDGETDAAVYRNATGEWFIAYSTGGLGYSGWGAPWLGDVPVPGDYDGDSLADVAVYRRSTGGWFIRYASGGAGWYSWGGAGFPDVPIPGDYDGDGATDAAVYRPENGVFYVRMSLANIGVTRAIGPPNQIPVNRPVASRLPPP